MATYYDSENEAEKIERRLVESCREEESATTVRLVLLSWVLRRCRRMEDEEEEERGRGRGRR